MRRADRIPERRTHPRRLRPEPLEPRLLLAAQPVISEIMASNGDTLDDADGDSSDWIELFNAGDEAIDLTGWHLTDRPGNLNKWTFPAVSLAPAEYLVVFASGKDTIDAGANLHTNFSLAADGEYVALVAPDGATVASEFGPGGTDYPPQYRDVSYGPTTEVVVMPLIEPGATAYTLVPSDDSLDGTWYQTGFALDGSWTTGPTGVGFAVDSAIEPLIGTDVQSAMHGVNASTYVRVPFDVADQPALDAIDQLTLDVLYDDGFVAYLNGVEVARRNAPDTPAWDSTAEHADDPGSSVVMLDPATGGPVAADPALVGWWKADVGVLAAGDVPAGDGARVVRWENQADPSKPATQTVVGDQPIFRAAVGDMNAMPAIDFLSADRLFSDVVPATGNGDRTLIAVFQDAQGGNHSAFYSHVLHYGSSIDPWGAFGITAHTSTQSTAGTAGGGAAGSLGNHYWGRRGSSTRLPSTDPVIFTSDFDGANKTNHFFADSEPAGDVTITDPAGLATGSDRGITIGGIQSHAGNEAYTGLIAEVIAYDVTLDEPGRVSIETYLAEKYGIGTAHTDPPPPEFPYADFADVASLELNGSASQQGNRLQLTPSTASQAGSAFLQSAVSLARDYTFSTEFVVELANPAGAGDFDGIGADGMTFTIHADSRGGSALGSHGAGLGLANEDGSLNIQPFVAVELDTYHAGAFDVPSNLDTNGNHLAVNTSQSLHSIAQTGPLPRFNDGGALGVWVDYDGTTNRLDVYLSDTLVKPATPALTTLVFFDEIFQGQHELYLGFTAGTGGGYNAHQVLSWDFVTDAGVRGVVDESIDLTGFVGQLQVGQNVLAVHGLNDAADDDDFLALPTLTGRQTELPNGGPVRYFLVPTPGGLNGIGQPDLGPIIDDAAHTPSVPTDTDDLVVTATIIPTGDPVADVTLHWRVMYGDTTDVPMVDDGSVATDVPGDGVFTAVVPHTAFAPGEMVRYFITAVDSAAADSRAPLFHDREGQGQSAEYFGTVVADPTIVTTLPVFHWFVAPGTEVAAETRTGTRAAVFYDGQFYDNVFVRRRGDVSSSGYAKANFKFDFNRGEHFRYDPDLPRAEEININGTWSDKSYIRRVLAWETYAAAGSPHSVSFPLRMQQNGQFFSVAVFVEQPDETFFERQGVDPVGPLYKMDGSQLNTIGASRERMNEDGDFADLQALIDGVSPSNPNRAQFVIDHVDLPRMFNYLAASVVMHENDHMSKNYYVYRNTGENDEWFMLPWDKDLTYGKNWEPTAGGVLNDLMWADNDQIAGKPTVVKPSHPLFGDSDHQKNDLLWNRLIDAIYDDPTLRAMYLRRLRSVMDAVLQPPGADPAELLLENRIDELVAQMTGDVALDRAKWGNPYGVNLDLQQATQMIKEVVAQTIGGVDFSDKSGYLPRRRDHLYTTHSVHNTAYADAAGVPDAQLGNPAIAFGQIEPRPASGNQDEEFIELVNPGSEAVDLTGWRIDGGVDIVFREGVVIPGGGSLFVSPDVRAFRSRATAPTGGQGHLVIGNYAGHLSNFGEPLELIAADGQVVASVVSPVDPSPAQQYLRVSEVYYHPHAPTQNEIGQGFDDKDLFEFIELVNTSETETLDLTGVRFTVGVTFDFSGSAVTSLTPGERVLAVKDEAAFAHRYGPGLPVAGAFSGDTNLANGGEWIKLEDADNGTIAELEYNDGARWPAEADGLGSSLEVVNTASDYNEPTTWYASPQIGGTPGAAATAAVLQRLVFYDGSAFDADDNDAAIAPNKIALRPGETATAANYTNFDRGVNGVIVDIAWPDSASQLTDTDFTLLVGNTDDPGSWTEAAAPDVDVVEGAGRGGSNRVYLSWPGGGPTNTWLQVTTLAASSHTGLIADDVFYFGNAVGETGNAASNALVTAADLIAIRNHPRGDANRADLPTVHDINRDRLVDATDALLARNAVTGPFDALRLITPPLPTPPPAEGEPASDRRVGACTYLLDAAGKGRCEHLPYGSCGESADDVAPLDDILSNLLLGD